MNEFTHRRDAARQVIEDANGEHLVARQGDDLDVVQILRILRKRIWVIVGSVAIISIAALLVTLQLTPLFTATSLVLIDPREKQVVDMEAVLSGLPPDTAAIDSEVEVLRSRRLASRVIDELNLVDDPEFNPALKEGGWMSWLQGEQDEGLGDEWARNEVIDTFIDRMSVSRRGLTYVIAISFTSNDGRKAQKIANTISDLYILEQLEAKFDATRRANEWLNQRLEELRSEVRAAEEAVEIYRKENDLIATDGVTIGEQQLAELNGQLILARADLAEREAKFRRYEQLRRRGGGLESLAEVLQSPVITDLRQQEAELVRKQAELSSRYGERHPEMIKVAAERRDLEQQIASEVKRTLANIENEVEVARTRVASLTKSLRELETESGDTSVAEIKLRELERDAEVVRTLYQSFLSRFRQTSEQESLQESDARVISPATLPLNPSFPRVALILVVAVAFSSMLGFGLAFLVERLDNAFTTVRQLEASLGLPHLASMPMLTDGKLAPIDYLVEKPLSSFGEAFRALRTALVLSDVDNPPKVVLVTSALPGDGKTTTAVGLARASALAGAKVALVDCDLRHPSVHRTFNAKPETGVVEVLTGEASLESALIQDTKTGLQYLPVKSGAANPPDLLGSRHFQALLEGLRSHYDLVILDSAPVLPVVDSKVLGGIVDKVVFVTRWQNTPRDAAENAVTELDRYGADFAGVVFSQLNLKKHQRYGYGDSGYYYGRYSKYYVS